MSNFKDTNIHGNFTVKPLYATYSNIGVPSGDIVVPAYFQNTGTTDLNHISINGTMKILGTNHLKDTVLSQGFYANWNDSGALGETSFINSKGLGLGGFKFYNVGNTVNSSVLLMDIDGIGNIKLNGDVTVTGSFNCAEISNTYLKIANYSQGISSTDATRLSNIETKTTNFSYTGGLTILQNPNNTTCTLSVGDNSINDAGATYGMVNLTRTANDYSRSHLAFIKASNCVWQVGYLNASNNLGFLYGDYNTNSGTTPKLTFGIDGKIGVGVSSPTEKLDVNGNVKCTYLKTSSDYRLKQNVQPLNGEYDISKLNPVSYQMMGNKATGFLAHELQEVFPHLVSGKKDGYEMQSVDYIGIIAILTYNLQDLKKEVDELKSKLNI